MKMPPPVKVAGRPRGSTQTTVIGTNNVSKKKSLCTKFTEMRESEKEKFVLSLCIGENTSESVLRNRGKVSEEDIDPTEISGAVFNSSVCLQSIKYMFTDEAWNTFQSYFNSKSEHFKFLCFACKKSDLNGDDLITLP